MKSSDSEEFSNERVWVYGMIVSNYVTKIVASDGISKLGVGEAWVEEGDCVLTREEYLAIFAYERNGKYYWKEEILRGEWLGPYGITVSGDIEYVIDANGKGIVYRGGKRTDSMMTVGSPTKAQYYEKYTVVGSDGRRYWKP